MCQTSTATTPALNSHRLSHSKCKKSLPIPPYQPSGNHKKLREHTALLPTLQKATSSFSINQSASRTLLSYFSSTNQSRPTSSSNQSDLKVNRRPTSCSNQSDLKVNRRPTSCSNQSDLKVNRRPTSCSNQSDLKVNRRPTSCSNQSDLKGN